MRHVVPYITGCGYAMTNFADRAFAVIDRQIGQLLVVMFLFYSGYGVMISFLRKVILSVAIAAWYQRAHGWHFNDWWKSHHYEK